MLINNKSILYRIENNEDGTQGEAEFLATIPLGALPTSKENHFNNMVNWAEKSDRYAEKMGTNHTYYVAHKDKIEGLDKESLNGSEVNDELEGVLRVFGKQEDYESTDKAECRRVNVGADGRQYTTVRQLSVKGHRTGTRKPHYLTLKEIQDMWTVGYYGGNKHTMEALERLKRLPYEGEGRMITHSNVRDAFTDSLMVIKAINPNLKNGNKRNNCLIWNKELVRELYNRYYNEYKSKHEKEVVFDTACNTYNALVQWNGRLEQEWRSATMRLSSLKRTEELCTKEFLRLVLMNKFYYNELMKDEAAKHPALYRPKNGSDDDWYYDRHVSMDGIVHTKEWKAVLDNEQGLMNDLTAGIEGRYLHEPFNNDIIPTVENVAEAKAFKAGLSEEMVNEKLVSGELPDVLEALKGKHEVDELHLEVKQLAKTIDLKYKLMAQRLSMVLDDWVAGIDIITLARSDALTRNSVIEDVNRR